MIVIKKTKSTAINTLTCCSKHYTENQLFHNVSCRTSNSYLCTQQGSLIVENPLEEKIVKGQYNNKGTA